MFLCIMSPFECCNTEQQGRIDPRGSVWPEITGTSNKGAQPEPPHQLTLAVKEKALLMLHLTTYPRSSIVLVAFLNHFLARDAFFAL